MSQTIKTFEANGHKFLFVCEFRDTRSGFAHDVTGYMNDVYFGRNTCHYLNRTWESWTYQTAIHGLIRNRLDDMETRATCYWKQQHNVQRVTKKRRPELEAYLEEQKSSDEVWKTLIELNRLVGC